MTNSHGQAAQVFVIFHRSFVIGHFELEPDDTNTAVLETVRPDLYTATPMTRSGDCPSYRLKAGQSYEAKVLHAATKRARPEIWILGRALSLQVALRPGRLKARAPCDTADRFGVQAWSSAFRLNCAGTQLARLGSQPSGCKGSVQAKA